jgi:hypothetical protein
MGFLKNLLGQALSKNRRRAERLPAPQLAAFYWTNAAPAEHRIRDISISGLYLMTEERWYPGTLVMMTLQKKEDGPDSPALSISVQSRAVRWGADGVGLEFILPDLGDRRRGQSLLNDGADRKSLEKFLTEFRPEHGSAIVNRVGTPQEKPS